MEENYGGDTDYKSDLSPSDRIKLELLRGLIDKNVNLSDFELAELTGFPTKKIQEIRDAGIVTEPDKNAKPLSWDYVLAFNIGDKEAKNKVKPRKKDLKTKEDNDNDVEWEEGMDQQKYFGQIFNNFWKRLETAKLSVEAYKSTPVAVAVEDEEKEAEAEAGAEEEKRSKYMFLICGITENNLKIWADDRDTDLLIDPEGGVKVGRERDFALARRTKLPKATGIEDSAADDTYASEEETAEAKAKKAEETLPIELWENLYGEYSQQANEKVYKHYKRLPTDDKKETVFDERTRLRIIYESIIADTNEGGAEIKIAECLANKKHPLCAVFPLHNQSDLDYFNTEWIKTYNPAKWMWCPLSRVRDYFGEPVAFYFAFLQFYLKWLIAPAIIGIIFFIWQLASDEIAVSGIPFLCFFMIFWCVAFVDFWARAESRYRLMWGMTKFQQKAVARPQFNGQWQHDSVSGLWTEEFSLIKRTCRVSFIYSFVTVWVSACVVAVIYVLSQRDDFPNDLGLKVKLGILNGVMIFVFDFIYKLVSVYGNEWENHRTEEDFENAMIYKSFVFKFVNSFSSLFYLGFIRPESNGLYYYVHFYTDVCSSAAPFMSQFLNKFDETDPEYEWFVDEKAKWEAADPKSDLGTDYNNCINGDADDELYQSCIDLVSDPDNRDIAWLVATDGFYPAVAGDCPTGSVANGGSYTDDDGATFDLNGKCYGTCKLVETQINQNEAVLSELRIQLLTLFLTAIIIQNTLEVLIPLLIQWLRARKAKALHEEKSVAQLEAEKVHYENTIDDMSELIVQFGYVTLFVMAFPLTPLLAIVNNIIEMKVDATNLVATSQRPHPNGSYGLGSWNGILGFFSIISVGTNVGLITWRTKLVTTILSGTSAHWIFFSVLSILLSIVVGIEKWVIPDVPLAVDQAVERQRLVEAILILGAGVDIEGDEPPADDDEGGAIQFDPSLEFIDAQTLPDIPQTLNQTQTESA